MAVTIDATAGGADANSYITLSEANAYVEAMVLGTDPLSGAVPPMIKKTER